jgi:hypothetical protein
MTHFASRQCAYLANINAMGQYVHITSIAQPEESRRPSMHKSTLLRIGVSLLLFTAAADYSPAQTMRVTPIRSAAPVHPSATPEPTPVPTPPPAVAPPATGGLVLSCPAATGGVVGVPYTGPAIAATGGTPPYAYTINLPSGLTLNPNTGVITGTPTATGTFSVKVSDHAGNSSSATCSFTISQPSPEPGGLALACPTTDSYAGMAFNAVSVIGGATPFTFSSTDLPNKNLTLDPNTGVITGASTTGMLNNVHITVKDHNGDSQIAACTYTIDELPWNGSLFPTMYMGSGAARNVNINSFFSTDGTYSFFNQIKSIYNGASSSATVSADLASLNFPFGWQVTAGTNIQAGSTSPTAVSTGTIPTLSATSAGQATQNMLYGGTIFASGLYPLLATGADNLSSAGAFGMLVDLSLKEGVDVQNFKSGTSTNVNAPSSHASAQVEGYMQYNSTNLVPGSSSQFAGAVFVGGSYGYSYTSHDYARDYGFGNQVNNGLGQISAGILINNVAKIALSRAFGPSQTYIDSTSMAQTTVNNFKSWSFGITYQSPPPASK